MNWSWFHRLSSPRWFFYSSQKWAPWLGVLACLTLLTGTLWGLLFSPPDYLQGNSYRIIFLHIPAASLALSVYVAIALSAAIGFVWKIKLADMAASCLAPIGASFCALALATGAIWGKPTWGAWWVWDARLTSMLILLFLYMGLIALRDAISSPQMAARMCAILAIVGIVNIPVIKFSVDWWNTLHQGATISVSKGATMAPEMLIPLLISIAGFYLFCLYVFVIRLRTEILHREQRSRWALRWIEAKT